ncbi:vitellogenin-6-like [Haemaphysalis longicornis]
MRILCLLLLVGCSSGFDVGKEYVYNHKGTLKVLSPDHPQQSTVVAFRSKVLVQVKPDDTHFKILNFEADTYNAEHLDLGEYEFDYKSNENLVGALEHPFAGKFHEGKLEEVVIGKNEPMWVRNVKKGILSLFQLDLVKGRLEQPTAKEYHVKEDGLHGACDTLYIIHEEEHDFLEVTKVKNLEKCEHVPHTYYGRVSGKSCVKCGAEQTHPYSESSQAYYELKGTRERYVIQLAWAESENQFKEFGEGKEHRIVLNRTMELEAEHDAPTIDTTLPGDVVKEHSLLQEFATSDRLHNPEDLKRVNPVVAQIGIGSNKDILVQSLEELARLEYTTEDTKEIDQKKSGSLQFLVLYRSFLSLNYDDINDIYRNHVVNAPDDVKDSLRHLFLDLLAATGQNAHVAFGIDLIKNKELSALDADRFYVKLHLNLKEVSPAMIEEIADSCKSDAVKGHREIWTSCKLAASAVASGEDCHRSRNDHDEDTGTCAPELVSHLFNYSVTPADVQCEPERRSTVFLQMAGNLATRKALHYLERFICPTWHASEHKRMAALWALKQAAKRHKELARSIALPVFFNETEPSEIRIAAFLVVVVTNPNLYLLRHIALEMITEPSDQVTHFVASAFHSLAQSQYPCHREMVQHLRYVLPLWENIPKFNKPVDVSSSHMQIHSGYNEKYDFGGLTLVEMIRSHDSYLPRNGYLAMKDYVAGKSHDTFAFSFESWGLDRLINRLVGPQPGSTKSLWDIFGRRRFPRDALAKERKEIEDALPIADREYDPAYIRMSLSVFGKAVDSWEYDESVLGAINTNDAPEKTVKELLGGSVNKKFFYVTQDMTFMAPTELGVPVFFEIKQVEFIYANCQRVEITQGNMAEITLNLKHHYRYEVHTNKLIGTILAFDKSSLGTGIEQRTVVSWPLELKTTLSPLQGKLKLHRPLGLPYNVGNHHAHPFTFKMPYDITKNRADLITAFAQSKKPLYHAEELKEFDRSYFGELLGMTLNVKGHFIDEGLEDGLHEFFHEMTWRERIYYFMLNPHWHPRNVKVYLLPAAQDATKAVDVDISYKLFESDDVRESRFSIHDQIDDDAEVPSTHVLNLDVHLRGDTKDRSVTSELRYSFSHDLFKHKLQFFYDRCQFSNDPNSALKICLDASAVFPKPDWSTMKNMATFYQGKHVGAKLNLRYGDTCESGSTITINGQYTHTDDDERQITNAAAGKPLRSSLARPNGLHRMYAYCDKERARGVFYNYWCLKFLRHSSRLAKLTADVDYKNYKPLLNRLLPSYGSDLAQTTRLRGFFGAVRSHFHGKNGKLHVVSQVPWWSRTEKPHTDIVITTEDGHRHHHWNVPIFSHLLEPRVFSSLGYTNFGEYSEKYRHRHCDLQGLTVRTFDGTIVQLPETDCYKVVSRDCSPNKKFLILARATNKPSFTKAVKLFIDTTKVEILPVTDASAPIVRVDGTKVDVTTGRSYSHTSHDAELFEVRTENKWFELVSKPYGISLDFDGNVLFVQTAPFYRGKLCGLCGDYNLDRSTDLSGPDGHLYNNTLEFAKSYVVLSPDCHAPSS